MKVQEELVQLRIKKQDEEVEHAKLCDSYAKHEEALQEKIKKIDADKAAEKAAKKYIARPRIIQAKHAKYDRLPEDDKIAHIRREQERHNYGNELLQTQMKRAEEEKRFKKYCMQYENEEHRLQQKLQELDKQKKAGK